MFKSVFTKYITAFMLIIIISFTILASIISSMVTSYSNENTQDLLNRTAKNVKRYIEYEYSVSGYDSFDQYIANNGSRVGYDITTLAMFTTDCIIMITDRQGNLAVSNGNVANLSEITEMDAIPQTVLDALSDQPSMKWSDTLGGFFRESHQTYALRIAAGENEFAGAVFVCASIESLNELISIMAKTIIMASLWVVLEVLIAVYFISEKIIGPLKDMSRAAKSFAAGHFDVRVPVIGHDEVSELAVAFNNMATSLANLEDMRRTFLGNVSHDLRTPMHNIAGFIDEILDGTIPPEKYDYYLNVIATEVRRLSRLVSSLLDISRIQAGDRKFTMAPFDICEMARQILISFEQKIDEKHLDVSFMCDEDKMYVMADRDAIYQIFYNICDNGVKFSRDGGKYRISLRNKDKKVVVSVFNEGIGISEEDIPFVFDRFYKSDRSRGLDKTGTGLGLFIAKTIIDAHGEEISVKSAYGENCEFIFTLQRTHEPLKKYSNKNVSSQNGIGQMGASS